jgi:hypothetical protein
MKTLSAGMQAHITKQVTTLCTCWRVIRLDGIVLGFTDHDQDILFGGVTYKAQTGFTKSAISNSASLAVDELKTDGYLDDDAITEKDLRAGLWDYAEVSLFIVNWQDPDNTGPINLRSGRFGEVTINSRGKFTIELRGLIQQLQQTVGETYTPTCKADLGDARCKFPLMPSIRQALAPYNAGDRVLLRNNAGDKFSALQIINGTFQAASATDLLYWTVTNMVVNQGMQYEGNYALATTDWVCSAEQTINFPGGLEFGWAGQFTAQMRSSTIYQRGRVYVSFIDTFQQEIGNATSGYVSASGGYIQLSTTFNVPLGAVQIKVKIQTTKYDTAQVPASVPFAANYVSYFDAASLIVNGTERLQEGGFEPLSGSTLTPNGWGSSSTFRAVSTFLGMTGPTTGNYFPVFTNEGYGLAFSSHGTGTVVMTTNDYISLTAGGGITTADIDSGGMVLAMSWLQASWELWGTCGLRVDFYNASNVKISTYNSDMITELPERVWVGHTEVIPIPANARSVKLSVVWGVKAGSGVIGGEAPCSITDITGVIVPASVTGYSYAEFGGVEYQALNSGLTGAAIPTSWPRTLGATVGDGTITWQVVSPRYVLLATVTSVTDRATFTIQNLGFAAQYFQFGVCKFITGQNAGKAMDIADNSSPDVLTTMYPFFYKPAVGDQCLVVGCDKKITTCNNKFANTLNFRGFPFMPGTDQYFKVGSPASGGGGSGGQSSSSK